MIDTSFIFSSLASRSSNLVILVGPPHSGKTKYAKDICGTYGFERVSPELIRSELEDKTNKNVYTHVYSALLEGLQNGQNIVYDAMNCRDFYRKKIVDMCKEYTNDIVCIVMKTPLHECLIANSNCERPMKNEIIEEMYMHLNARPPHISEGYDLIMRV